MYVIQILIHLDVLLLLFSSQLPDRLAILTSKGVFVLFYNSKCF